jgi:hypothetical protein
VAAQPGGVSRGHDEDGALAVLLQSIGGERVGDQPAIGELADAA